MNRNWNKTCRIYPHLSAHIPTFIRTYTHTCPLLYPHISTIISTYIHNNIRICPQLYAYAQMTLNRNQCFQTIKIFFINRKMILPDLNKTCRIYPHLSTFTRIYPQHTHHMHAHIRYIPATYPLHTHYIPIIYPPHIHHLPTIYPPYTHIRPEA